MVMPLGSSLMKLLDLAVGVGGAELFGFQLGVDVLFHGVVAFVADADLLVVLDVFIPVFLGMK